MERYLGEYVHFVSDYFVRYWSGNEMTYLDEMFKHMSRLPMMFYTDNDKEGSVIMRWSGVKDAKDRKIFEGDIIEDLIGYAQSIVKFGRFRIYNTEKFCVGFYEIDEYGESPTNDEGVYPFADGYDVEVIGNIYENPELIKDCKIDKNA